MCWSRTLFNDDFLGSRAILKDVKDLWLKELGDFIRHMTSTRYWEIRQSC